MKRWALLGVRGLAVALWLSAGAIAADDLDREESRRVRRTHIVEVVEQVRDSVLNISATQKLEFRRSSIFGMFDEIFEYPQTTSGSGFVIHEDGYIVTNDHVVARSTDHRVRFADGREYDAHVVARDQRHDLAVLWIEPDSPLTPLKLGRSDDIMLGEDAIAIGNPFGLENSITRGVISALNRTLQFNENTVYRDLIQTDASINPGNSGGPLLNAAGELIGVNTAIRPDAQNVGFAIPVDHLRAMIPEMLDITKLYQVEFGMRVAGAEPEVVELQDGSPAAKAGVRLADVVTAVDGVPVTRSVDFSIAMLGRRAGDTVKMTVSRDGRTRQVTVKLTDVPKLDDAELAWRRLGLRLTPLAADMAMDVGIRRDVGLVIAEVDPRSHAARAGIRPGDLLGYVGRHKAWPLKKIGLLLQDVPADAPVDVAVYRFNRVGRRRSRVEAIRFDHRLYAR